MDQATVLVLICIIIIIWIGIGAEGEEERKSKKKERKAERKAKRQSNKIAKRSKQQYKVDKVIASEKSIPFLEQSISKQKHAIENADQQKLVDYYESAIAECKKFPEKYIKLTEYYEELRKRCNAYIPFYNYFSGYLRGDKKENDGERLSKIDSAKSINSDEKLHLYLVKLKSSIDNKLYLVVGVTTLSDAKDVFLDNPVVVCQEVIRSVSLKKYFSLCLENRMIFDYRPAGSLDAYSRFDGDTGIIEMRNLSKASSDIDEFVENEEIIHQALKDLEPVEIDVLHERYKEYGFEDMLYPEFSSRKLMSNFEYIVRIFERIYLSKYAELLCIERRLKKELNAINSDSYKSWQDNQVKAVKTYVKMQSPPVPIDSKTDEEIIRWYYLFDESYPLAVEFNNKLKTIDPFDFPLSVYKIKDYVSAIFPHIEFSSTEKHENLTSLESKYPPLPENYWDALFAPYL